MSEENNNQNNEGESSEITCIKCGAKNPEKNLFCTICGHHFVEKIICSRCNGEVPAFNTFCNHCGASMKTEQTIASQKPSIKTETERSQQPQTPPPTFFRQQQQQQQQQSQYGYQSQMRAMTPEEAQRYQDQLKAQQISSRNRTAMYFGIFLVVVGLFNFGSFLIVTLTRGTEISDTMLSLYGISFDDFTPGLFYGSLIATYILQGIIALILGFTLIFYKPENNAWAGFAKTIRYVFLGVVGFISLLIISCLFFWIFYNPRNNITGQLPVWLFTFFGLPVNMPVMLLVGIFMLVFFICLGLLIGPSIYKYVKDRKKKEEGIPEVIIEDDTPTISMNDNKANFSPLIAYNEVEKRKARMPDVFYRIKNSSFMKTFELLGLMFLVSLAIATICLLLGVIPDADLAPAGDTPPAVLFISATWAGISEEISFRLILIGLPMIVVVAIRYLIENGKISMPSYQKSVQGTAFFKIKSRVVRIDDNLNLTKWDIALAIRGKYKRVGYPEWILIGISALIFGLAHWEGWTGSWGAWKILHAGTIGIFLGYAFVKYGIESAIVLHFTNNALAAINSISAVSELYWMEGAMTFLVTSFSLLGMMKIFSEALNIIQKYRMRREALLLSRY